MFWMYLTVRCSDGVSHFTLEWLLPTLSNRNFLSECQHLLSVLLDLEWCVLTSTLDWCVVLDRSFPKENANQVKNPNPRCMGWLISCRKLSSRVSRYLASMKLHNFCGTGKYFPLLLKQVTEEVQHSKDNAHGPGNGTLCSKPPSLTALFQFGFVKAYWQGLKLTFAFSLGVS